uniref:protein wingless-like n=1 Tax=Styela clava TaxID=7725 RepID=UPI0019394D54|nr:protein wingless-like [Styela clava]
MLKSDVPNCHLMDRFTNYQKKWCEKRKPLMKYVSEGARNGISECQYQFRNNRWKCPSVKDKAIFGTFADLGSREMAFAQAITAAGVVHSISRACEDFLLPYNKFCPHSEIANYTGNLTTYASYSGFVSNLVKYFLDGKRKMRELDPKQLMFAHNNKVGRLTVVKTSKRMCRYYGKGNGLKSCWMQNRDFRVVADELRHAYEEAIQIRVSGREIFHGEVEISLNNSQLVYLSASPDYCIENLEAGVVGTRSRECNVTGTGPRSCEHLCCGRGYRTKLIKVRQSRCDCVSINGLECKCDRLVPKYICK